jgi:hypothetical protein
MALDLAAAVLAGGRAPLIEKAWRVRPVGRVDTGRE